MADSLTHETLTQILDYTPTTGHFTWKTKVCKRYHVGQRAGYQHKSTGYRSIRINGKNYLEHRLAWYYVYGEPPTQHIDHINHDRADNRISNLRQVSIAENARNRARSSRSRTGEVGIWYNKNTKKYVAQIRVKGRKVFQKSFTDIDEAIQARKQEAHSLGFHENHGE